MLQSAPTPKFPLARPLLFALLVVPLACASPLPEALPKGESTAGADLPSDAALVEYFLAQLDHERGPLRHRGIVGLGEMGPAAAAAGPRLLEYVRGMNRREVGGGVHYLLSWWALARIGTPEARAAAEIVARKELERLDSRGSFKVEDALRVGLLAVVNPERFRPEIDAMLPLLYTGVRSSEDPGDRLASAWALLQVGTPVTVDTADRGLRGTSPVAPGPPILELLSRAGDVDPNHLGWMRLLRPFPQSELFVPWLENILDGHDFGWDIGSKREQTALTLARLAHPDEHPAVVATRDALVRELDDAITWSSALDALLHLGPYACAPATQVVLERILEVESEHEEEHGQVLEALELCHGPGAADRSDP